MSAREANGTMRTSVLILTLNEERNLTGCLESVAWCDDIVVLDSFSTDRTEQIARGFGARFVQRSFDNYAAHRNWAFQNIAFRHPWVLSVDADERCTPELAAEIQQVLDNSNGVTLYYVRRKDFLFGQWFRHSSCYPVWLGRLARPDRVHLEERLVNAHPVSDGQARYLRGHLLHYPFHNGIAAWLEKHNCYSSMEAHECVKELENGGVEWRSLFSRSPMRRRRALKNLSFRLPARPLWKFVYLYVLRLGILDGRAGLTYCQLQALYERMICTKVDELKRQKRASRSDQMRAERTAHRKVCRGDSPKPLMLFLNQYYHPDCSATAQLLTDLAEWLARRGVRVRVLCGRYRYEGEASALPHREHCNEAEVIRVWSTAFGRARLFGRLADYVSFCLSLFVTGLFLKPAPDIIVSLTTPPMIHCLGAALSCLRKARFVVWSMDVYPDVAVALGIIEQRSLMARALNRLGRWALGSADAIVAIGEGMAERLRAKGVDPRRIHVVHNWADGDKVFPVGQKNNPFRDRWGLNGKCIVEYSGNMGRGHHFETILAGALRLKHDRRLEFLFIGGGHWWTAVAAYGVRHGLENLRCLPYQPREALSYTLNVGDVHLITLRTGLEGLLVPSKLYGIMAAGKPVLYVGPTGSETARIIRKADCGFVVPEGEVETFLECLQKLRRSERLRSRMGRNARQFFEGHFDKPKACARIEGILQALAPAARST